MDFPSRRARKNKGPKYPRGNWLIAFILLLASAIVAYFAVGNYMGLAAFFICAFFVFIGLNVGNIRQWLPGLSSEHKSVTYSAVLFYTCLGFAALSMAGRLPASREFFLLYDAGTALEQESVDFARAGNQSAEQPGQSSSAGRSGNPTAIFPSSQQEVTPEQTAPASKMDTAAIDTVVTKIINSHVLQINNAQYIRLIGIQVPESMEGQAANLLENTLNNQPVSLIICENRPLDEDGRSRAVVMSNGINVNEKLIGEGLSPLIVEDDTSIDFSTWQSAEVSAKRQKKGIWAKHPE